MDLRSARRRRRRRDVRRAVRRVAAGLGPAVRGLEESAAESARAGIDGTAAAVRLMGARCIISGISPKIAQTMVQLGVDVGEVQTRSSIRSALKRS